MADCQHNWGVWRPYRAPFVFAGLPEYRRRHCMRCGEKQYVEVKKRFLPLVGGVMKRGN